MSHLLEVNNLNVSFHTYAGEVQAVRGVSLHLDKEETLAIVGESGCGKTVTSKAIMGLIPDPPGEVKKGSEILYKDKNILKYSKKKWQDYRGEDAAMIFQDPMTSLNPTMKIGRQIQEGIRKHQKISKQEARKKTIELLKMVNIPNPEERLDQYPHEFSGGMRQRVMIAIALSCNPNIMIADEPTTALDVTIQAQILNLLREIQKKNHSSIIMITHDLGVVAGMADRIAVMYAGEIVEEGSVREIFKNPQHPYTYAMLNAVPNPELESKAELHVIKGTPPDLISPPKGCPFASRCKFCMQVCHEYEPEKTEISEGHFSKCWLHHQTAKKLYKFDNVRSVMAE